KPGETDSDTPVVHKYTFSDVSEATEMGKAVYALTDLGVINGYLDGTFKPANNITRAEFAKIMVTALNKYDYTATATFTDVPSVEWYYSFVASAKQAGLINGYPDGSFAPNANITRAEVMTVIYRALKSADALKTPQTYAAAFADDASIPEFAKEAVYALVNNAVVAGTAQNGATVIKAEQAAGRGDCAVMLYNALKLMGKVK
ncbi:MAG: S-layer homology domain-containing protein, partial [Clostridia bacterium]